LSMSGASAFSGHESSGRVPFEPPMAAPSAKVYKGAQGVTTGNPGPNPMSVPVAANSSSLVFRLALALASVIAYVVFARLVETLEPIEAVPDTSLWFHYAVGAAFGALVLGPYVPVAPRALRIAALALAGAVIYRLAVWFVTEGPIGYDALVSFVLAGAGAAVLSAIAVAAIARRAFGWRLLVLPLAAGAIGGATFDMNIPADPYLLVGHAAWQLLVCLALHLGVGPART
jgi:hypothetical protein